MKKSILLAGLAMVAATQAGLLYDFESGDFSGWTVSGGGAWTVGGATGTSPNIISVAGSNFARSGAPNVEVGPLTESNTGVVRSGALTVTHDTLSWYSVGWSGDQVFGDGLNSFRILDDSFNVVTSISTAQTDTWQLEAVDLTAHGFSGGETFYFEAVDNRASDHYSWLAFDDLQLSGNVIPEPASVVFVVCGAGGLLGVKRLFSI